MPWRHWIRLMAVEEVDKGAVQEEGMKEGRREGRRTDGVRERQREGGAGPRRSSGAMQLECPPLDTAPCTRLFREAVHGTVCTRL